MKISNPSHLWSRVVRLVTSVAGAALISATFWAAQPASADPVPNPRLKGPYPARALPQHPSHNYPFFATDKAINKYGYIEEEYLVEGTANRYSTPTGQTATVIGAGFPYRTRIVVRRPFSDAKFNGNVVVEWYNVTAGSDGEADWFLGFEHLMKAGYAWVGVSAQRVGVDYLKTWGPPRYFPLDVTNGGTITDDSLSYDIYSQVAQAIRQPSGIDPLSGLRPKRVMIADGESQSAGRLLIYVNSIMPRGDIVYDAVILHSSNGLIRSDAPTKVFALQAEYDATGTTQALIRPDTDKVRVWEVAGTAHWDYDMQKNRQTLQIRDQRATVAGTVMCTVPQTFTRTRMTHVYNRVLDLTARWVTTGVAPPTAPRIDVASYTTDAWNRPVTLARDPSNIVRGGIRLPDVAVPTALNYGENSLASGTGNCALYGYWVPFSVAQLNEMYPTHLAYVNAVIANVRANIRAGYINRSDGRAIVTDAVNSNVGADNKPGTGAINLATDADFSGPDL